MHDVLPRSLAAAAFALLFAVESVAAQAGLPHLGDVTPVPKGMLRLHAATVWTRYDSRFTATGEQSLGGFLTADSLGPAQLPELAAAENLVAAATGTPFMLSLGRSRVDATARAEVIPLTLEYGVTSRLAVGVTVPIVRKRIAVQFRLDTAGGFVATVGPNQHRTNPAASANNATMQLQFLDAASQLQSRLANCQANPSGPGCPGLLARQAEAEALIASSTTFAIQMESLYGSQTNPGSAFVPIEGSDAQVAIASRIQAFNAQYRDLLSAGADLLTAIPFGAGGPAGIADVATFMAVDAQRDSVNTQERVGVGDVEVGFTFLLFDRPPTEARRLGLRAMIASAVALPTGSDLSSSEIADMRLGSSNLRIDSRGMLDARAGRFGLLAGGRVAVALAEDTVVNEGIFIPAPDRTITELHLAPRYHLSEALAFHGAWSARTGNNSGTDQLLGAGVTFSGLSATQPGRTPPVEMRYTHLQAITGDPGRPKFSRDQIELRIYYRLRR